MELEAYGQAVRYYSKARSILHQYQHMPSFRGIQDDCQKIMADLAQKLRVKFRSGLVLTHPAKGGGVGCVGGACCCSACQHCIRYATALLLLGGGRDRGQAASLPP